MEFMTALQGTFDEQKPSLFEVLSEQQLSSLLPPSLRYLLTVATLRNPRYLLRVLNSFDELYALLMLFVERYYLRTHGGGFTENFYGLKRERALAVGEIPRATLATPEIVRETLQLTTSDVWKNLAVMVGVPYLRRKLDESYEINAPRSLLGGNYTRMPPNPTWRERFLHYYRWFLRNVYPSVNAAYYFATLAFNIAYLFDNSRYHSPLMWLIGTRVRRLGGADYKAIAALDARKSAAGSAGGAGGSNLGLTSLFDPRHIGPKLFGSLKILLPTSIFALKFLEWWHASDFAGQLSRRAAEGLELPPPIISGLAALSGRPKNLRKKSSLAAGPRAENSPPLSSTQAQDLSSLKQNDLSNNKQKANTVTSPPISSTTLLPIFTVPAPGSSSDKCPVCEQEITTPTATESGFIYCYTCIHRWVEGQHERQVAFMAGSDAVGHVHNQMDSQSDGGNNGEAGAGGSREGKWESGRGRCAVSGRRLLGGTEGLRRIMI